VIDHNYDHAPVNVFSFPNIFKDKATYRKHKGDPAISTGFLFELTASVAEKMPVVTGIIKNIGHCRSNTVNLIFLVNPNQVLAKAVRQ